MTQNPNHDFVPLALGDIVIPAGRNPRKYFDADALASLEQSITEQGVLQPVLVRPTDEEGKFELIAGERRFRASSNVGLTHIPAVIREMDDRAALAAAVAENQERDDISQAEEAQAARMSLDLNNGDRKETAKQLGWSVSKLEARLMLLHCSEAVITALSERKIKTGHAELFSTLPEQMQDATLPKIIEQNISVEQLKARIDQFAYKLEAAPFDTAGCTGCPHNSSTQASLFDFSVGDGRCSNKTCWDEKTSAFMEEKKADLVSQYNVVWMDVEKTPETYKSVVIDEVGKEQFSACQGCANFGALVSTQAGREGRVREDTCFKLSCHAKKLKERAKAVAEQVKTNAAMSAEPSASASVTAAASPATAKPAKPKAASADVPKAVGVAMFKTLAASVSAVFDQQQADHFRLAASTATAARTLSSHDADYQAAIKKAGIKLDSYSVEETSLAAKFVQLPLDTLRTLSLDIGEIQINKWAKAAEGAENNSGRDFVATSLTAYSVPMSEAFTVSDEFIDAHTKAGLQGLVAEKDCPFSSGYDEANGEGATAKLFKGKVDAIKEAMKAFDFGDFVPKSVSQKMKKHTVKAPVCGTEESADTTTKAA